MNNDMSYRGFWMVVRQLHDGGFRCDIENRAGIVVRKGERKLDTSLLAFADGKREIDAMHGYPHTTYSESEY